MTQKHKNAVTYPPRTIPPHKNQVGAVISNSKTIIEISFDVFVSINVFQMKVNPIEKSNNPPSRSAQIPLPNNLMKNAVERTSMDENP